MSFLPDSSAPQTLWERLLILLVILTLVGPTLALFVLLDHHFGKDVAAWIGPIVGVPTSVGIIYLWQQYTKPAPSMTKQKRDELVAYFESKLQSADYVGLEQLRAFYALKATPIIDPNTTRRYRIILGLVLVVLLSILALGIAAFMQ